GRLSCFDSSVLLSVLFGKSDFRQLFFEQLFGVKIGVVAIKGEQLVVSAKFDNVSGIENGNAVGIAHGGDTVGNENCRSSLHDFTQMVQDLVFSMGIHAGKSIIKNQNSRIPNQSSRNCRALLLA